MIGGTFLWLFAGLAVIFNLVGYFYSDRIALRVARAQPLSEHDAPEIYGVVRGLAARAQIPTPRLYVMPGEQPNAFASGRSPQHAAIAATEGLLSTLPLEQIEGVPRGVELLNIVFFAVLLSAALQRVTVQRLAERLLPR